MKNLGDRLISVWQSQAVVIRNLPPTSESLLPVHLFEVKWWEAGRFECLTVTGIRTLEREPTRRSTCKSVHPPKIGERLHTPSTSHLDSHSEALFRITVQDSQHENIMAIEWISEVETGSRWRK